MARIFASALIAMQLAAVVLGAQVHTSNPIAKVIEMIGELQQKIIGEGDIAQKIYAEFAEWCEDESKNLRFEIKTARGEAEDLQATIEEAQSTIGTEEAKIEELSGTVATDEADLKAATAIRTREQADFAAEEKEMMGTVDTLERASSILERELGGGAASLAQMKHATSLIQSLSVLVESQSISGEDKSRLSALIQTQEGDQDDNGDSDKTALLQTLKAGGAQAIIDTINDMLDKSEGLLADARKKETKAKGNYMMLKMDLDNAIAMTNKELDKCKKRKAEAQEVKAINEGDLSVTAKDLGENIKQLNGIHHDCMTKAQDFEVETASRAEELKALATAKKIVKEMVGGAFEQVYDGETSLLQMSSQRTAAKARDSDQGMSSGAEAIKLIKRLARKTGSSVLVQLADRMMAAQRMGARSGEDPFAKIKGLIGEMIEKLMKEAEAEGKKNAYCDKEMSETKANRADKTTEIEDLTATIDKMSADSKTLKEEVAVLSKELADLAKSQAEMDKVRKEQKEAYDTDKAEMEQGLEGIKLALKVLREYYAKGAFVQSGHAAAGADGIIGLLEVAESDFSKGLEEMISAEEQAVGEYEKATQENEVAKTTKEQDNKYKTQEAKALDKAASEATSDRDGVQTELDAVLTYWDKIKEECIAKADPYEERKKRREEEIAGLKEALEILSGNAVFLQESVRHVVTSRHLRHKA